MSDSRLIYLDNAATSFPKPESVIAGMADFMRSYGGNPGRGSHFLSMEAARRVYECRCRLAEFFDADSPECVSFTLNTTQSLNFAIKGLLNVGDHVLISDIEHNAVYRPVFALAENGFIEYSIFPSMALSHEHRNLRICMGIADKIKHNTRMLVCTAMSNICSASMPLAEIGELCRRRGILFVVDGAQAAGHTKLSMKKMNIDALCLPAHKGLLGAQGCGILIMRKGLIADTLIEGGNGTASLEAKMSLEAPERYEAGTVPTPAIVSLCHSLDYLNSFTLEAAEAHEKKLFSLCADRLADIKDVQIYCPQHMGSVLLFNVADMHSEEIARRLSNCGICTRGGYHCSALGHATLGTQSRGGVRAGFGIFNTPEDIDGLYRALKELIYQ